jgi:ribosomal protein S18 acetylase RimI-like enzyme
MLIIPAIRRAIASDLETIVDLRMAFERITRDSGSLDEASRRAELASLLGTDLAEGRLVCWLAEDGGHAVAQAALRVKRRAVAAAGGLGELLNVYTDPAYRGRGIGSALVAEAMAEASALGLGRLRLRPTDDSRRIYERAGFRAEGGDMVLDLGDGL